SFLDYCHLLRNPCLIFGVHSTHRTMDIGHLTSGGDAVVRLIRQRAKAENLQRSRRGWRCVVHFINHVRGPAVIVENAIAATAIPADTWGTIDLKQILVGMVVPDLCDQR